MDDIDIVERLRRLWDWLAGSGTAADELLDAADEIERLRAAGDALAEALEGYQCHCSMSKCRCGHDAVLDAWREARREQ